MSKLTDTQKKKIIAETVEGATRQALATKYGVSMSTIQRVLQSDPALTEKVKKKKEANVVSVFAFMDSKKETVCDLIDKLLTAMNDPEKIQATSLSQLATTMGIVIDKYTATEAMQPSSSKENNLFEAINSCEEAGIDDLPEIQQATKDDATVVEDGQSQG